MSRKKRVSEIPDVTQNELKKIINYEKSSGIFTWISNRGRNKLKGKIAGTVTTHPHTGKTYIHIEINNKPYRAHRLAWLYMTGKFPACSIDHIDGQGTNNSWNNLREADVFTNAMNVKLHSDNRYGVCGVSWEKRRNKWVSYINCKRKRIHLGYFMNFADAVNKRKLAEQSYGYHNNHGTIRAL